MEISFAEKGSGEPLVLLHGFCETGAVWNDFSDELAKSYHVLMPDLPGFGKTPIIQDPFTISDIAETIYNWLKAINIESCVVIGHSLGGYVTLALAEKHAEILKGFGLFHSTAYADGAEKKLSRDKTIEFVKNKGVEVFARSFVPQLFYVKNRKWLEHEISSVVETAALTSFDTLTSYTIAMRDRPDRTAVLRNFDKPILIIAGTKDTSVPVETIYEQEPLAKNAFVHIYQDTGHMGMFEKTEPAQQAIKDFMISCG